MSHVFNLYEQEEAQKFQLEPFEEELFIVDILEDDIYMISRSSATRFEVGDNLIAYSKLPSGPEVPISILQTTAVNPTTLSARPLFIHPEQPIRIGMRIDNYEDGLPPKQLIPAIEQGIGILLEGGVVRLNVIEDTGTDTILEALKPVIADNQIQDYVTFNPPVRMRVTEIGTNSNIAIVELIEGQDWPPVGTIVREYNSFTENTPITTTMPTAQPTLAPDQTATSPAESDAQKQAGAATLTAKNTTAPTAAATATALVIPTPTPSSTSVLNAELAIQDDFESEIWDNTMWDSNFRTEYAMRQDGVLYFKPPSGEGDFTSYWVDSALPGSPHIIKKVSFRIKVDTQPAPSRGDLGAEISCDSLHEGRFIIFWGGAQEELWMNSVAPDGQESLRFLPVKPGEENLIDLTWIDDRIEVRLNGGEETVILPSYSELCWMNFTANLEHGEAVSGYIDDVKVYVSR